MVKEKQNSYTESSYSKLESTAAEHSTEISVVPFPVKIFWGKKVPDKIRKPEMVSTVQTQVICLISETEDPRMPNASASQTTELYGLLYGENILLVDRKSVV